MDGIEMHEKIPKVEFVLCLFSFILRERERRGGRGGEGW